MSEIAKRADRPLDGNRLTSARLAALSASTTLTKVSFLNSYKPSLDRLTQIHRELTEGLEHAMHLVDRVGNLLADTNEAIDNYRRQEYNGDSDNGEG